MSIDMPSGSFTDEQRARLLLPIDGWRVFDLDGQSHLAAWDVIAHLNREFGFEGWDKTILDLDLLYEHVGEREVDVWERGRKTGEKKKVLACSVGYRCTLRLTVRNPCGQVVRVIEDAATGTAKNQRDLGEAHDLAIKSAVSYALKRCAKDLGDQFGLSLYNKGQQSAVVMRVFPYGGEDEGRIIGKVHADGIDESDEGFGNDRGTGEAVNPATEVESHPEDNTPPVREPEPAKPKADKPEPTPPPEQPETPTLSEKDQHDWLDKIRQASSPSQMNGVWSAIKHAGLLDALVPHPDDPEKQVALREYMVERVNQFEVAS